MHSIVSQKERELGRERKNTNKLRERRRARSGDRTTKKLARLVEENTAEFKKHMNCFVHKKIRASYPQSLNIYTQSEKANLNGVSLIDTNMPHSPCQQVIYLHLQFEVKHAPSNAESCMAVYLYWISWSELMRMTGQVSS